MRLRVCFSFFLLCQTKREHIISYYNNVKNAHPDMAMGFVIHFICIPMLVLQIIAYVSQVHNVVLPEDLIDHETMTLDQVSITLIHVFFCILSLAMPRVYCRDVLIGNSC